MEKDQNLRVSSESLLYHIPKYIDEHLFCDFFCYLGFETDEHLGNVCIIVIHTVSSWLLRGTEMQLVFDRGRQGGMKFSSCEPAPECLNYILCKTELSLSSALILVKAVKI